MRRPHFSGLSFPSVFQLLVVAVASGAALRTGILGAVSGIASGRALGAAVLRAGILRIAVLRTGVVCIVRIVCVVCIVCHNSFTS